MHGTTHFNVHYYILYFIKWIKIIYIYIYVCRCRTDIDVADVQSADAKPTTEIEDNPAGSDAEDQKIATDLQNTEVNNTDSIKNETAVDNEKKDPSVDRRSTLRTRRETSKETTPMDLRYYEIVFNLLNTHITTQFWLVDGT